jgi:hypothetical protein
LLAQCARKTSGKEKSGKSKYGKQDIFDRFDFFLPFGTEKKEKAGGGRKCSFSSFRLLILP